jgi:hypothetical protein
MTIPRVPPILRSHLHPPHTEPKTRIFDAFAVPELFLRGKYMHPLGHICGPVGCLWVAIYIPPICETACGKRVPESDDLLVYLFMEAFKSSKVHLEDRRNTHVELENARQRSLLLESTLIEMVLSLSNAVSSGGGVFRPVWLPSSSDRG